MSAWISTAVMLAGRLSSILSDMHGVIRERRTSNSVAALWCWHRRAGAARADRMLLVVQAHRTCNPLREELGEQLVDNREKRKWSVGRAVPRVTAFWRLTVQYPDAMRVARTALNRCVNTCTPVPPEYMRSSVGIPSHPAAWWFLRLLMQPCTSSNVNSTPSLSASCPGRARSAASAACARATYVRASCVHAPVESMKLRGHGRYCTRTE